jgi:hypothetical protein
MILRELEINQQIKQFVLLKNHILLKKSYIKLFMINYILLKNHILLNHYHC